MSCKSPLLAVPTEIGTYKVLGAWKPDDQYKFPGSICLPCGKCVQCRLSKSREWADRCMLELDHTKKAVFVTLTYDELHVPTILDPVTGLTVQTLRKRDFQLFIKRLRKEIPDYPIRYLCAGEYGEKFGRPHMHIILFGISSDDLFNFGKKQGISGLEFIKMNELDQPYYRSDWLWQFWQKGIVNVCEVSWKTCAYVARYTVKKLKSEADDLTKSLRDPEFLLSSRKPGLGLLFAQDHPEFIDKDIFYFSDQDGSIQVRAPSRLIECIEAIDPDKYLELKKERYDNALSFTLSKLSYTDLCFEEYKDLENEIKENSYNQLDRFPRE